MWQNPLLVDGWLVAHGTALCCAVNWNDIVFVAMFYHKLGNFHTLNFCKKNYVCGKKKLLNCLPRYRSMDPVVKN